MVRNDRIWDHHKYWIRGTDTRKYGNGGLIIWRADGPKLHQRFDTGEFEQARRMILKWIAEDQVTKNESFPKSKASNNCPIDVRTKPSYC